MSAHPSHEARHLIKPKLPIEHTGFYPHLQRFLESLAVAHSSEATLTARDNALRRFIVWCDERDIDQPQDVSKAEVRLYQKSLHYAIQANGEPLKPNTQNNYLHAVKQFFSWLSQEDTILFNPAADMNPVKIPARLPSVLSTDDIEALMLQPELSDIKGLRDRAILEVLYSTGLRRAELCNLELMDINLEAQTLMVRKGKGNKDRLLPLGESASHWVDRYLKDARPQYLRDMDNNTVFLNNRGNPFRHTKLGDLVKRYLVKAGITAPGSCHLLRHAMATHMLENGADLRFIQSMLGHSSPETTQIYTHVAIQKLQSVHAQTHPAPLRHAKIKAKDFS